MNIQYLHQWTVTPKEAVQIQNDLRKLVILEDDPGLVNISKVAGVDNAYIREGNQTYTCAAVVILSYPSLEMVETQYAMIRNQFPYVPGLLSFREAPAILAAFGEINNEPDLILLDGQGYAHPRRMGLASHLGLFLDRPTIGCAKSRLIGEYQEPAQVLGEYEPLLDSSTREQIGSVLRTRPFYKPLFVSPGHKVSIITATRLAMACARENHFLPEPVRLAHQYVTKYARSRRFN